MLPFLSIKKKASSSHPIYLTVWLEYQIGRSSHLYCAPTMCQMLFQTLQM